MLDNRTEQEDVVITISDSKSSKSNVRDSGSGFSREHTSINSLGGCDLGSSSFIVNRSFNIPRSLSVDLGALKDAEIIGNEHLKDRMLKNLLEVGLPNTIWDYLNSHYIDLSGTPLAVARTTAIYIAPWVATYCVTADIFYDIWKRQRENGGNWHEALKSCKEELTVGKILIKACGSYVATVGFEGAFATISTYCGSSFTDSLTKATVTASVEAAIAAVEKTMELTYEKCFNGEFSKTYCKAIPEKIANTFVNSFIFALLEDNRIKSLFPDIDSWKKILLDVANAVATGAATFTGSMLMSSAGNVYRFFKAEPREVKQRTEEVIEESDLERGSYIPPTSSFRRLDEPT
jgi:hypothetical protein